MRWWIVIALAVSCGNKTTNGGSGSGVIEPPIPTGTATTCEELRGRLGELYRAEGQVTSAERLDELVADNTEMVLRDCAKVPDRVIGCVNTARSVAEIEARCVIPLDEEGSEGLELRK